MVFFSIKECNKKTELISIIKACDSNGCCPEVLIDEQANLNAQIVIKDDFCKEVRMSREQFIDIIYKSKNYFQ